MVDGTFNQGTKFGPSVSSGGQRLAVIFCKVKRFRPKLYAFTQKMYNIPTHTFYYMNK